MEFGKVDAAALAKIDLSLFPDDPRSWLQLGRPTRPESGAHMRLRLGCPVWGVKGWLGKVYPPGTKTTDFLRFYAEQFESIELNTTHYRVPDSATIQRWRDVTPPGFRFCPKFPQDISHGRFLSQNRELTREFLHQILGLEHRLGMSFLQLPPHFAPMDLPELKKFLIQIPKGFELAVEVRHPGFFQNHTLIAPLFDLLASTGTHAVILDVAGRRDVLHLSLPTPKSMVRFIGNALHPSDHTRLTAWTERLVSWRKLGLNEMYFFVHQPDDVLAPDAITIMTDLLNNAFAHHLPNALEHPLPRWKPPLAAPNGASTKSGQLGFELE